MLAMGGRTTDEKTALEITAAWLDTEFEGGRHQRRVDMLNNMQLIINTMEVAKWVKFMYLIIR